MEEKTNSVNAGHYVTSEYLTEKRFATFRFLLLHVLNSGHQQVAEVGKGSAILTDLLKGRGVTVTTVDIAEDLHPDILLDLRELGTLDQKYDCIICSQVLEHLPFSDFALSVRALIQAARREVLITIPDKRYYIKIDWKFPGLAERSFHVDFPFPIRRWTSNPEHCWEMNQTPFTERKVLAALRGACQLESWQLADHRRIAAFPYHHFFSLRPRNC